ncbi:HPP family protein [Noviherbaspirillum sedimenti]|uniref:HPP family protein n=1 Tax=Noviherbaspirillum sedimenti TaxID=2320865 RepID=A0A3A3G072_9BURK|nr:HPP family protein [Noviherbaspirillum sedimenti]RJG01858.1 HPP family protein [Noviherbaspirillum sedimenti]
MRNILSRGRSLSSWIKSFLPQPVPINGAERLRACCGALFGILLTGLATRLALGPGAAVPLLIAPMGASAILLFAVPSSPLAQPWSIIGGNTLSAAIGVAIAGWVVDPLWGSAIALTLAIAAMLALRCLHPPSGAIALMAVLGGPAVRALGYGFVLMPVALNSVLLLLLALFFNNATGRRYPHALQPEHANLHRTADAPPIDRLGFTPQDLDDVLKQYNQMLDISRDDLEELFMQTERHAFRRRLGEITCADIMSRDVITVEFGTPLDEAWNLLHWHRIKALPVVNRARRVVGIVTLVDFLKHANPDKFGSVNDKLRQLVRPSGETHTDKPDVVGQIMSKGVLTASTDTHIVELVPVLSNGGKHHVPVVDVEGRLAGMLTQSDLIAALYRGQLLDPGVAA